MHSCREKGLKAFQFRVPRYRKPDSSVTHDGRPAGLVRVTFFAIRNASKIALPVTTQSEREIAKRKRSLLLAP